MNGRGRISDRLKIEYARSGLLTVAQVAQRMAVSQPTVWGHINAGTLTFTRVGKRVLVPAKAVDQFIAAAMRVGSVA
jgi:excisionase family DNA binding protein